MRLRGRGETRFLRCPKDDDGSIRHLLGHTSCQSSWGLVQCASRGKQEGRGMLQPTAYSLQLPFSPSVFPRGTTAVFCPDFKIHSLETQPKTSQPPLETQIGTMANGYTRCPFTYGMFFGTTALFLYLDHLQKTKKNELPNCKVVFVLGGPGAGKVRNFCGISLA